MFVDVRSSFVANDETEDEFILGWAAGQSCQAGSILPAEVTVHSVTIANFKVHG